MRCGLPSLCCQVAPSERLLDENTQEDRSVLAEVAHCVARGDGRTGDERQRGFPRRARGTVRLPVEGIAVWPFDSSPVSAASAPNTIIINFPGGEGRYPSFLAVPIVGPRSTLGCMVVQRGADRPFSEARSAWSALTAPVSPRPCAPMICRADPSERPVQARKKSPSSHAHRRGPRLRAVAALRRPPLHLQSR